MNIPRHTAGVELLQQQQINGCGSEQAVNGNYCMHMHKSGALRAFAASKINIIAPKSGCDSQSERYSGRRCFTSRFVNFASHVILSGSDPDNFKTGSDLVDPTRFQRWLLYYNI